MKALFASISWFLAAWFVCDATAFLIGLPRQVTRLVALVVAAGVWLDLHAWTMARPSIELAARAADADLGSIG